MIPKIIHYCWFGDNKKPSLAKKCIKSWHKYCPDYQIIEWNESNFDISTCPLYIRQAYEQKKWAFVTDYVRLKVVYDKGGIYLDTDVELLKNPDNFLNNEAYFGFEDGKYIATGLGFGAVRQAKILLDIMEQYDDISFIKADGTFDTLPCPMRNTEVFLRYGLVQDNSRQLLKGSILILPKEYFSPMDYHTKKLEISENTYSVHWFSASWQSKKQKAEQKKNERLQKRKETVHYLQHLPNRIMMKLLGDKKYEKLKRKIKK